MVATIGVPAAAAGGTPGKAMVEAHLEDIAPPSGASTPFPAARASAFEASAPAGSSPVKALDLSDAKVAAIAGGAAAETVVAGAAAAVVAAAEAEDTPEARAAAREARLREAAEIRRRLRENPDAYDAGMGDACLSCGS
jgi:hypothetical protein